MKKNNKKTNGLNNVVSGLLRGQSMFGAEVNNLFSIDKNTRFNLLTLQWQDLTNRYCTNGIYRTLVEQPVLDAIKGKLEIETNNLEAEEIEELYNVIDTKNIYKTIKNLFTWDRLFGGCVLIIEVEGQDLSEPLSFNDIKQGSKVNYYVVSRWELSTVNIENQFNDLEFGDFLIYQGQKIHKDRLIILKGVEAPFYIKQYLGGWGLSCLEPLVAPSNTYDKAVNLVYELIDEAKIDILKIDGLNTALISGDDKSIIDKVQTLSLLKNYKSTLAMDTTEDYQQRQLNLAGIVDILRELKLDICSAMKMPMTKIWGLSPSGFNSGENDLKNYNNMVEAEIRPVVYSVLKKIIKIECKRLFGIIPNDLNISYPSLEQLNDLQSADLRQKDFTIINTMKNQGDINFKEYFDYLQLKNIYRGEAEKANSTEYSKQENMNIEEKEFLDI